VRGKAFRSAPVLLICLVAAVIGAGAVLAGCGRLEATTIPIHGVSGPGQFDFENVPRPWGIGGSGYGYEGHGHFYLVGPEGQTLESFYWRDGHFVWADGKLADYQPGVMNLPDWQNVPDSSERTIKDTLNLLVNYLSGLGWWVRHTYIDSLKPLAVTFAVDDGDNGPFIEDILLRQFLYARYYGLNVDTLGIEYTSRPGTGRQNLTPAEGMAQSATKLWLKPPEGTDDQALNTAIAAQLPGEAARPGWTVKSLEVTTTYLESLRVNLTVVAAVGRPAEQAKAYAADVLALIQALNAEQGAGIAVLRFDAFDAAGAPLVRERWDLDLGRHSSA
jgi:hypothetical protein